MGHKETRRRGATSAKGGRQATTRLGWSTSLTRGGTLGVPQDWLDEVVEFIRIPSISSAPEYKDAVERAAGWVRDYIVGAGGSCEIRQTPRQPLVVGEVRASGRRSWTPTILIYGHFDVQPPGNLENWLSPPFEPEIRDGWLYGRGAADDKGNLYMLLKAVALMARNGGLPVNVQIVCDGEEEILGSSVVEFVEQETLSVDAGVIFDGPMPEIDRPTFRLGTRGLVNWRIRVETSATDVHSGHFGGVAMNATQVLVSALSALLDRSAELRIGVQPPPSEELASWKQLPGGDDMMRRKGVCPVDHAAGRDYYLRTLAEPSLEVTGLDGGDPARLRTVVPAAAEALLSLRVAPGQDSHQLADRVEAVLKESFPEAARFDIRRTSLTEPGRISPREQAISLARDAFKRTLGVRPLFSRSGGTIPIVPALQRQRIPTVLTGFDVPEGNVHGPNERLLARYIVAGVRTAQETFRALGTLGRREG